MTEKKDEAEYRGPGMWFMLHMMASEIESEAEKDYFIKTLEAMCKRHPCGLCSGHCQNYLKNNDPRKFSDKDKSSNKDYNLLMSKYMWLFHNTVNARLNKPIMKWETYYSIYYINRGSVCHSVCGVGEDAAVEKLAEIKEKEGNPFITVNKKK